MKENIKSIIKSSFYQLLIIYSLLVFLVSLNIFYKYTLHFEIFALILAILGISIISKNENKDIKISKTMHYLIFVLAVFFIFLFRFIPYINNTIPIGYDSGLYKYGIEKGLENKDLWILSGGMEPGFLYLMEIFKFFFSIDFILRYLFIISCIILGIAVYFVTSQYFNKNIALISIFIYSVSLVQLITFTYMYYKNIIGLSLALFAIYFLKKSEKNNYFVILFIILASSVGWIHRPTFYIFGLSYFVYAFCTPYKKSVKLYDFKQLLKNIIYGILIILFALVFYLGDFKTAILIMIEPVLQSFVESGESPGTFIDFFTYQFSSLIYLPFAILGFFVLFKKKQYNLVFFWALITGIIVYFQFFFFNRFIIHLDIALIILASVGFYTIIENKKKLGIALLFIMLVLGFVLCLNKSLSITPLINENEINAISYLSQTPKNSFVLSSDSYYSPWIIGYSNRKTIAPGLFDYNVHNKEQWTLFWTTNNLTEMNSFLNNYKKPLYIFIGQRQRDNIIQFNSSGCFELFYENKENKVYNFVC
ncbi:MAG: glycosyltransferase family 39 protein [Candidatus Nanoarchaeia archaeon]